MHHTMHHGMHPARRHSPGHSAGHRTFARGSFAVLAGLLAAAPPAAAQLVVDGRPVELAVGWVGAEDLGLVRVVVSPLEAGAAAPFPEDAYLLPQPWAGEPPLRFREAGPARTLERGGLRVTVDPADLSVTLGREGDDVIAALQIDDETGALTFPIGSAPLLGLGQGGQPGDRRDAVDPLVTSSGWPWHMWYFGGRVAVPWLVSAEGWGIYFHAPHLALDLRGEDGRALPAPSGAGGRETDALAGTDAVDALPLDVFLAAPREPAALGSVVARLLGPPELPPLWALGYQQSHRTLGSRDAVMSVPRAMRERRLPADVLIYLGTGYVPSGWNTGHGSFAFHPEVFPDPEAMMAEMEALDFRVIMHVNRAPGRLSGTVAEPGSGAADYWREHLPVLEAGAEGFWPDEGESMSAESKVARIRMYHDGPRLTDPDARPYALFRSGFPGMQRYGGWLWSGDVWSDWATFRKHVAMGLHTSLSGITFWGSDTGGFWTTREYDGELFTRWFQFSAFTPIFRSHGRTWRLHTPFGWSGDDIGPGEIDPDRHELMDLPAPGAVPDPRVEPIARRYLELRYRLMPYLYSLVWEAHERGTPIMRPVWMHSDDPRARRSLDEYMWGPHVLVAPVMEEGARQRTLYLPRGTWYDFWTGDAVEGGREVARPVDLATMPLYVRAGAVLPMGPVEQHTGEKPNDPLTLVVHPGADGGFTLVEDAGTGEPRPGERMTLILSWDDDPRTLTVRSAPGSALLEPMPRTLRVRLPGEDEGAAREVRFTGEAVTVRVE